MQRLGKRPILKLSLIVLLIVVAANRRAAAQAFWGVIAKVIANLALETGAKEFAVLGAGCMGLCTARLLLEAISRAAEFCL